jgi:protocatechuate 3,4-dioxygenase beta subunit
VTEVDPPYLSPDYRSTVARAPSRALLPLPEELHRLAAPVFGEDAVAPGDADLTSRHAGEPLGERIIVTGRVLDDDGRPVRNALLEVWQANAAGRYVHEGDEHPAPLDPNFTGAGRTITDDEGRYRFITVKPGAYPWKNHPNAWRPAHIHFSVFGRSFTQRLVTQMYFPGDPQPEGPGAPRRPIRSRDNRARMGSRVPVGHHPAIDAVRGMRTPSQTVGPFFTFGLCMEPQNELPGGTVRLEGQVFDGQGSPVGDAMLELWSPAHGFGRCPTDRAGRFSFLVPSRADRFELMVFARGLLKPGVTRLYLDGAAEDDTMVARRTDEGYRFDVRLQGEAATGFFDL